MAVSDTDGDSAYGIATRRPTGEFERLKDAKTKIMHTEAGRFDLVYGDGARLLVDSDQLGRLIERCTHLEGRKPGDG